MIYNIHKSRKIDLYTMNGLPVIYNESLAMATDQSV